MPTAHKEQLQLRIRELEKEVARLHNQIKQQRYGLHWIDVPEAFDEESENKIPTLEEVPELSFHTDDGKPTHILIEGDNYHALTCLNYTHRGKVDVIYIDPPYNTGSDGFIYKDKRILDRYPDGTPVPASSPQRHSYWLSFMHRRLELAKNLLSERGVIFISIDDNEQANLKLLCDEVFGENNFVSTLVWQKKFSRSNDALYFSTMHDYILCYCRHHIRECDKGWRIELLHRKAEIPKGYGNPDNDIRGVWTSTILSAKSGSDSFLYEIELPSGRKVRPTQGRYWSCTKETFEMWKAEKRIWFGKNGNAVPRKKTFLSEVQQGLRPNTIIMHEEGGNNQEGKQELKKLMGGKAVFNSPKPCRLIELLLKIASKKNKIILDFFAGSGTTLHATMNLNEEDGGKRQCILVQYPEKTWEIVNGKKKAKKGSEDAFKYGFDNITEITYERNRRVMQGYTDAKGKEVEGLGNSLKYYRTAFVGENDARHANEQDRLVLSQKAGCLLALAENTLDETLRTSHYQLFTDGERLTAVYFQEDLQRFEEFVEQVRSKALPTSVYVFCWGSADEFLYNFEDIPNVSLKSIPEPILKIYQTLNA